MVTQLKKGVLEYCVLLIISSQELYGYEIMKRVGEVFPETSEQTVYTILRRLLKDGYTHCYSKGVSSGPPRKYYQLTPLGKEHFEKSNEDWQWIVASVERLKNII